MTDKNSNQKQSQSPVPHPELKRLDALVGLWHSEGQTRTSNTEPSIKIIGTDHYEWLPGGFFLIHRVDVKMGDEKIDTIEMIGSYEESSRTYSMRSFDSQGNFQTMEASVEHDGVWTFAGDAIRATLVISSDSNSMTAHWEQTNDGSNWLPWMDMKFTRAQE